MFLSLIVTLRLWQHLNSGNNNNNNMKQKENKSIFLEQFGDTPQLRLLDFLIDNQFFDYPVTEMAKEANISYNSLKDIFPQFLKSGIIVRTRKVGKSDYYKLNLENDFVRGLIKLDWMLTEKATLSEESYISN